MRHIVSKLGIMAATLLLGALPVLADEGVAGNINDRGQSVQKNECLLVAMNCGMGSDSVEQRIERLNGEIRKGTDVYTTDELRKLRDQLSEELKSYEGGA